MLAYTFQDVLTISERIHWRVDDLIGQGQTLDFRRPFLPESLARTDGLASLSADERRLLNQIRGHGYLYTFGLVEEFILPFLMDHARPRLHGASARTRALLQFASEEAKHIELFRRFREEFQAGFGHRCDVIGPPEAIAQAVLSHDPLGVALVILQVEWMTQRHYLDSVRDDRRLDPMFKSLLKHHWMEEAQHAKLDTLLVEALAEGLDATQRRDAVEAYLAIGALLDGGLRQQVTFDLECFERASGRTLTPPERTGLQQAQHQAQRWTFLGSGMTHPGFVGTLERITPEGARRVAEVAPAFC